MARRKKNGAIPLPPRSGLGASRVRLPDGDPVTAFDFIVRVITEQRHRHPDDDDSAVLERFDSGEVVLRDGTALHPDQLVQPGTDVFFYRRPAPEKPVPYDIETVYEDDTILVVDKPPFLATMPRAAHIPESATVRLRRATGNEDLTPAHRLDRMTSGLLLLTKQRQHRGAYQELFAARQVRKHYEAIAEDIGITAPTSWHHHIDKQHGEIASTVIEGREPNALTHVREALRIDAPTMQSLHSVTFPLARYLLEPVTGRTHQLRVQMNEAEAPILGDPVYPTVNPFGEEDFAVPMRLKSVYLGFRDPLTGAEREFGVPGFLEVS